MDPDGIRSTAANTLGEIVDVLKQKGHELVGEVQAYENVWRLCYVRGPEGIIIELAEQL